MIMFVSRKSQFIDLYGRTVECLQREYPLKERKKCVIVGIANLRTDAIYIFQLLTNNV